MVNYFIYAKDYSGSTSGTEFYHEKGLQTFKQFKNDVYKIKLFDTSESQTIYLHWGTECVEVDHVTTLVEYDNQCGNGGGTYPETIIQWIKDNIESDDYKIKLLYIVTDGLIGRQSFKKCLDLNQNMSYENVVFHGINECPNRINLSIAVSFLKRYCTIYRNNELMDETNVSDLFDYTKINVDNFAKEKENLKSYVKLKYINASNKDAVALAEIDELKKMRNRLFDALSLKTDISLDTKDKNTFLREFKNTDWYKHLTTSSYDLRMDIEKSVNALINYITSDKKSHSFDALKFGTKYSNEVRVEEIVDIDFTTDQEIEFPDIILDDEKGIPVILLTELNLLDKIIFNTSVPTASFSKFRSMMECPLFLLNDPEINESIGYFYTLTVYKQLLENSAMTEPRTRKPFHGGLVLVDTDDFDLYNDYILSATYFNYKKVKYNIGLFYFVLWKICEKKQWMDKNVVEQFKKYMLRRVSTSVCKIGLLALPLDPQVNTLLPTALWYCVELSSEIFKQDPNHFAQERLRMYYGVSSFMIEILNYLQYDLDLESINKRRDIITHVMVLKKIPRWRDKVLYLVEKIFKKVNGFLVCEIENQANVGKLNYLRLDHKKMLDENIINNKVNLNDYVHFLYHLEGSEIPICEKTFRPFFMIDQEKTFYSELLEVTKKVVINDVGEKIVLNYDAIDGLEFSRILSYFKLFLNCVQYRKKIPTLQEYMDYILKRKKYQGELVTIFAVTVCEMIENVYKSYERVTNGVCASEVLRLSNMYVNRIERIKAEKNVTFGSDVEINEILQREETKMLNLNKT